MAVGKIRRFDQPTERKATTTKSVSKNVRQPPKHHKVEVSERVGVRVTAG